MNYLTSYSFGWKTIFGILVLAFAIVLLIPSPGNNFDIFSKKANIGVIDISGTISSSGGEFFSDTTTPENIRKRTEEAENQNMDAIVYSINSPGGSVVASREIKRKIEATKVPTVCEYKDVAASGALWLSMGCDVIVSDSLSLTGSVGSSSSYLEFTDLMEKLGIEYVNISTGKYKSAGSPYKNISQEEVKMLKENTEEVKEVFIEEIRESRGLKKGSLENVSDGRIILGKEAKELGLVDHLGGREKVKEVLKDKLEAEKTNFKEIKKSQEFSLLNQLLGSMGYGIGKSLTEKENSGLVSTKE